MAWEEFGPNNDKKCKQTNKQTKQNNNNNKTQKKTKKTHQQAHKIPLAFTFLGFSLTTKLLYENHD